MQGESRKGVISLQFDEEVAQQLRDEFGSLNAVYSHLENRLDTSQPGNAEVVPASGEALTGEATRAGVVEIVTATAALVTAVAPIVVAWFRSRNFEVETFEETRADGTRVVHTRIRRGASS